MKCPSCDGTGNVFGHIHYRDKPSAWDLMPCLTCANTGVIDNDYPRRRDAGYVLRHARVERYLSMAEVARAAGVSVDTIAQVEDGRSLPDATLRRVYERLDALKQSRT